MFRNLTVTCEQSKPLNALIYGCIETEFGQIFMGHTLLEGVLQIGYLHFTEGRSIEMLAGEMQKYWKDITCKKDLAETRRIFDTYIEKPKSKQHVVVLLNGTDFQNLVWSTLCKIPYGCERTYEELAIMINRPKSVRPVASAVAKNNIAVLVPCHRIKAKNNDQNKYRWGSNLKKKLLMAEQNSKSKLNV